MASSSPDDTFGLEPARLEEAIREFTPVRFRNPVPVPDAALEWASTGLRTSTCLYIHGPLGTGKTHLSYQVISEVCRRFKLSPEPVTPLWDVDPREVTPRVVAYRATTLFDELRPGNPEAMFVVRRCRLAPLLFVDDLGAEKPSEWTKERIYEVVDDRYANLRPFIVTSNLPPNRISESVGERVASRLQEIATPVPLVGVDRRRPA